MAKTGSELYALHMYLYRLEAWTQRQTVVLVQKARRYTIGMTLILTQILFITLEMCSLMYVRRQPCFFLYWLAYNKSILLCAFHLPWSVIGTACVSLTVAVGAAESRDDASRQQSGAKQRGRRSDVCNARQSSDFADMYVLLGASRGLNIQDPIILLSRRLSYQDLHDPNRQWELSEKRKETLNVPFKSSLYENTVLVRLLLKMGNGKWTSLT